MGPLSAKARCRLPSRMAQISACDILRRRSRDDRLYICIGLLATLAVNYSILTHTFVVYTAYARVLFQSRRAGAKDCDSLLRYCSCIAHVCRACFEIRRATTPLLPPLEWLLLLQYTAAGACSGAGPITVNPALEVRT